MSRRPTRPLTWEFVLRTFKRVDMIAARYSSEAIAKALIERGAQVGASDYMRDIWDCMRDLKRAAGVDPYAHPSGDCPQCGKAIMCDHNGARYCSRKCRQRAWRERKAVAEGRNSPVPKRARTKLTAREAALKAAMDTLVRQKEALAFANSMYALHLKAHPDETSVAQAPPRRHFVPRRERNKRNARRRGMTDGYCDGCKRTL